MTRVLERLAGQEITGSERDAKERDAQTRDRRDKESDEQIKGAEAPGRAGAFVVSED